ESSLGAWFVIGRAYPVWATLSTSGLIGIELPLAVKETITFPDGDIPYKRQGGIYVPTKVPPGRAAARALHDRLAHEGVKNTVAAEPPPPLDYANLWNAMRAEVA
ncbi:MAG TPA: hypothetical protein VLJ17_16715, partial [Xanthobacteraceae bacterium]|nr:hypothetical protein [Xanthobacteraceae bacterium]